MTPELSIIVRSVFTDRTRIPELLNRTNLLGEVVEVGVWRGDFSAHIRKNWTGKMLYCVDVWPVREDMEHAAKLVTASGAATMLHERSVDAAKGFEDGRFDLVYIDADHEYRNVKEDIEVWFPKVKDGGFLCGNDFVDGTWAYCHYGDVFGYGVRSAVLEFASCVNRFVFSTREQKPNWLIVK